MELIDREPPPPVPRDIPQPKFANCSIRTTEEEATTVWSHWIKPTGSHLLICNLGKPSYIEERNNMLKSAVASRIYIDLRTIVGDDVKVANECFMFWNMMLLDPAYRYSCADVKQSAKLDMKKISNLMFVSAKESFDAEKEVFVYVEKMSDVVVGAKNGKWIVRQEDLFAYVNSI